MTLSRRVLAHLLLTTAMLMPLLITGCAAHVRYYDEYGGDYHSWNGHEDRSYRAYWGERHENYREYKTLNKDEQRDYWKWRHEHPDSGKH